MPGPVVPETHPLSPVPGEQALMDLSVTLAHRIRSLVASIEGYTDLLSGTLGTSEQRELALRIFEGAARIERILADLQLYGQPLEPVTTRIAIVDVVEDLLHFLDDDDVRRVEVVLENLQADSVRADPVLLRQALLSMVKNALEASKETPIRICASGGLTSPVRFDVWNVGRIDLEDAARRVFVPFFTTKAQSIGIGLPVARRIAEAHGGSLILSESDAEGGTCFSLCIPSHEGRIASVIEL